MDIIFGSSKFCVILVLHFEDSVLHKIESLDHTGYNSLI